MKQQPWQLLLPPLPARRLSHFRGTPCLQPPCGPCSCAGAAQWQWSRWEPEAARTAAPRQAQTAVSGCKCSTRQRTRWANRWWTLWVLEVRGRGLLIQKPMLMQMHTKNKLFYGKLLLEKLIACTTLRRCIHCRAAGCSEPGAQPAAVYSGGLCSR